MGNCKSKYAIEDVIQEWDKDDPNNTIYKLYTNKTNKVSVHHVNGNYFIENECATIGPMSKDQLLLMTQKDVISKFQNANLNAMSSYEESIKVSVSSECENVAEKVIEKENEEEEVILDKASEDNNKVCDQNMTLIQKIAQIPLNPKLDLSLPRCLYKRKKIEEPSQKSDLFSRLEESKRWKNHHLIRDNFIGRQVSSTKVVAVNMNVNSSANIRNKPMDMMGRFHKVNNIKKHLEMNSASKKATKKIVKCPRKKVNQLIEQDVRIEKTESKNSPNKNEDKKKASVYEPVLFPKILSNQKKIDNEQKSTGATITNPPKRNDDSLGDISLNNCPTEAKESSTKNYVSFNRQEKCSIPSNKNVTKRNLVQVQEFSLSSKKNHKLLTNRSSRVANLISREIYLRNVDCKLIQNNRKKFSEIFKEMDKDKMLVHWKRTNNSIGLSEPIRNEKFRYIAYARMETVLWNRLKSIINRLRFNYENRYGCFVKMSDEEVYYRGNKYFVITIEGCDKISILKCRNSLPLQLRKVLILAEYNGDETKRVMMAKWRELQSCTSNSTYKIGYRKKLTAF